VADQLATPSELASALQQDLDASTANLWVNAGTAVVQATCGQRILQVVGDTAELMGTTSSWLDLPQIPVTSIASVTLDGTAVTAGTAGSASTTYRRVGSRLWRTDGWQNYIGEPSTVVVVNTHGYASGRQELELARLGVLSIAKGAYANPSGALREAIDDYQVAYQEMAAQMDASPFLAARLRKQYGRPAGLVRIG
jgi:hypothetical protein